MKKRIEISPGPVLEVLLDILIADTGLGANLETVVFHPGLGSEEKNRYGNVVKAGTGAGNHCISKLKLGSNF